MRTFQIGGVLRSLAILAALLLWGGAPAQAQYFPASADSGGIVVTGMGEVRVPPGRILLYAAFSHQSVDATEAVAGAAASRDRAAAALRDLGVSAAAVTASGAGFGDHVDRGARRPPAPGEPRLREALFGLRVEVEPVSRLDEVLRTLAAAGMESLPFAVAEAGDVAEARGEAVRLAVTGARAQAEAIASAAGVRLGRLLSITALPDFEAMGGNRFMQYGGMGETWARLIPSDVMVRASVSVAWEIAR